MMFCNDLISKLETGSGAWTKNFDDRIRYHEIRWTEPTITKIEYNAPGDPVAISAELIERYGF